MKRGMIRGVLMLWLWGTGSASAELYVICNKAMTISPGEIADIFLGGKQFSGATRLLPVDNAEAQEEFLSRGLKMTGEKYSNIWTKKSFRDGLTPPSVLSGDREVLELIRKMRGGVGYVRTPPSNVNIIKKY